LKQTACLDTTLL
jgi:hypothetical protein